MLGLIKQAEEMLYQSNIKFINLEVGQNVLLRIPPVLKQRNGTDFACVRGFVLI